MKNQNNIENQIENQSSKEVDIEKKLEALQFNYDSLVLENQQLIEENQNLTDQNQKYQKVVERLQSSADNSDKFRDQLVAMKADFDSYKRRMRNDSVENRKEGQRDVFEKLLPVLDTYDMAKAHLDGEHLRAFELTFAQLEKILADFGVEKLNPLGQDFNVNTMNAFSSRKAGEQNAGKVVEVYQAGYSLEGKVLRYAEVIVGEGV